MGRALCVVLLLGCLYGLQAARVEEWEGLHVIQPNEASRSMPIAQQEESSWALALMDGDDGHANTSMYCNEHRVHRHDMFNKSEGYFCWGTFAVFGKYVDEDDHVRAMWGGKCEGKFVAVKVPGKAVIVACGGLTKQFAAHELPHRGDDGDDAAAGDPPRLAAVRGGGCNGKHVLGMVSTDGDDDGTPDLSPVELHELLAQVDGADVVLNAQIEQALREVNADDGRGPGRVEMSCEGKGGMFRGVVPVPRCRHARAAMAAIADVDGLEGMMNMSMLSMGVSLFPGMPPTHPPPPPHPQHPNHHGWHSAKDHHAHRAELKGHMDAATNPTAPAPACAHGGMRCSETCNGKRPWFHGMPCWGKFRVHCARDDDAEAAGKVADDEAEELMCGPRELRASCEGMYTGWFGNTCRGFASKHIEGRGKDVRTFCSGKEGIIIVKPSFIFHIHSHGYASWCDGSSLATVAFDGDDGSTAATAA